MSGSSLVTSRYKKIVSLMGQDWEFKGLVVAFKLVKVQLEKDETSVSGSMNSSGNLITTTIPLLILAGLSNEKVILVVAEMIGLE